MNREMSTKFVEQFMQLWIEPEIAKRRQDGCLPQEFDLYAAQVSVNFDQPDEVRLNNEIIALESGKPTRPFPENGRPTIDEAFTKFKGIELTHHDPNAGHLTLLRHRGDWLVVFDFRCDKARIEQYLYAAREFLDIASLAFKYGYLRAVVENLFSAVELMAKGQLIMHDKNVFSSNGHNMIYARFNMWGNLGDTDQRFPQLLIQLFSLRKDLRCLEGEFSLSSSNAKLMIDVAEEMYSQMKKELR
jgi:uncharacterized protein (UPF0332 family)